MAPGLEQKLNSDAHYSEIAKTWEGDLLFLIEPAGNLKERLAFYLDLWHGTCRKSITSRQLIVSQPGLYIDLFLS